MRVKEIRKIVLLRGVYIIQKGRGISWGSPREIGDKL